MNRRSLLKALAAAIASAPGLLATALFPSPASAVARSASRIRPGDPAWPAQADWDRLSQAVGGRLVKVVSPLAACASAPSSDDCTQLFKELKNPYYLGDEVGLTQTLGWVDAWTSQPSAYAVAARTTEDVVAAVNFARQNNLRLVVKGGGHSYQGTSNSADSLLVWTRGMNAIALHEAFVGAGCAGAAAPQPAVTIEAGAIWEQAYDAVMTKGGRYVQGGGCLTVGVAGLIQGGGFGSFSKGFGMAAASLLEAEIVTADGAVKIANACANPDLFWALKGGGGGGFGVVTRLTLRTHDLPEFVGAAIMTIEAKSDDAYRRLIGRIVAFYNEALFNPHWGEQIAFRPSNVLMINMTFQGLGQQQAQATWKPFLDWLAAAPQDFTMTRPPIIIALPARSFWDPGFLKMLPGVVIADDRPGAPAANVFWAATLGEAGWVLHGYQSAWLPASLLRDGQQDSLADALFAASRRWGFALHLNKGLAGAPSEAIEAAKDTAMNPAVVDAFALVISAAEGPPAYPGIAGHEPDIAAARAHAQAIEGAMSQLRKLAPSPGAYFAESNFFEETWRESFWGPNYAKLLAIKNKYDPDGLFFGHHGVGSERWSADGFTRLS